MSEYRSQHTAELEQSRFTSALVLGIVLAGFVATMFLINSAVTQPHWQPYLGKYSDRVDALVEYGDSVTAVFVGSSHILDALSPRDFDATNAALGQPEVTYNAAQYGAVMPIQRNTLQTLEQSDLPDLRYVFFEPMLMSIPFALDEIAQNAFSSRNRYFYDTPTSIKAARMRWASDRSFARRAVGVAFIGIAWIIHKANLGVIRDVLAPPPRDYALVTEAWEKRGFTGGTRAPDPNLDFSEPPEMEKGYRQISETELLVLDEFVATIRRAGAEPIFIFPPTRANLGKQRAIRDAAQARYTDITVLDYSYDTRPLDIYFDESLWLDPGHMTPEGARMFSTMLAREWRALQAGEQSR